MVKHGLLFLFLTALARVYAQCPVAGFTAPATACLQENIFVENTSTSATSYQWDFCSGDLQFAPAASFVTASSFIFRARVFRMVQDINGMWFGFAIDEPNNTLVRFDFGNSPDNTPTVTSLGNPGSAFQNPIDLDFLLQDNQWYALVANTNGNNLLRLDFGSSLTNNPAVINLGSFGVLNAPSGVDVIKDQNEWYAFVTIRTPEAVISLRFGNSILNTPAVSAYPVAGASGLRSLSFVKECDRWFAMVSSYNNGMLFYLFFDNGINAPPVINAVNIPGASFSFPATLRLTNEGGHYYALVQSAFPAHLYRIDFGESITDLTGTYQNLGNLGISNDNGALELVQFNSHWRAFSIDLSGTFTPGAGRLFRITFPENCASAFRQFTGAVPPTIQYSAPGVFRVALNAVNDAGHTDYHFAQITVNAITAPDIDFTVQNECANHPVNFTSINSSGNITAYQWNFGDAGISSQQNPAHTYAAAGLYMVNLGVTADNGCANRARQTISIYNPPVADFQLPAVTPFCTNQPYLFSNTSTFDVGSSIAWSWQVNGTEVSNNADLMYTFLNTLSHEVKLTASIPGCQSEAVQNINSIAEGPIVNFTSSGHCQQEPITFTNTTTGTVTSYLWDFDDGSSSTDQNPVHAFTLPGVYQVQLTAANSAECVNSATKPVAVYSKPQTDFSVALPPFSCSGTPTQFTDLTPNPFDSNLAAWLWDFGGGSTSTLKNPQHTFAVAGLYPVSLTVTTNFGCSASIQKDVQIYPSPVPAFTFSPPCRSVPVQFTDATAGSLQSWLWQIESSTYTTQNPVHTFATSGAKNVIFSVTAANGCVGTTSQIVTVPNILLPDFMAERTCTNQQTLFTSLTNDAADPIVSYQWNFGTAGTATGNPASATFTSTGNPLITLTVTTQTGCAYARTKNVAISSAPVASFNVSADAGGVPLTVQFTNTSTGATSYLWNFGEGTTSTEISPQFTYTGLGTYVAELTAFNAIQCEARAIRTIHVVTPVLDVRVPLLELLTNGDGVIPAITVENRSNVPLNNPAVAYDLSGRNTIREVIPVTIAPNTVYRHVSAVVYPSATASYLCATVLVEDNTPADNRQCVAIENAPIVIHPFPNPVSRQQELTVGWTSRSTGNAAIHLFTTSGQEVLAQAVAAAAGYNSISINTSRLPEGLYLLRLKVDEQWFSFRVQVTR